MSSKSASRRRRQAANRNKYARLRKAGQPPQHTTAERRHAAADRVLKREVERRRLHRTRRVAGAVVVPVVAVAVLFSAAPALTGHLHHNPYPVATQPFPFALAYPDHPDWPHQPDPDATFYTPRVVSGTAVTAAWPGPTTPKPWRPWEWLE